jgi:MtrB/PioB family decaheme-associated outer membrane protein
MRTTIHYSSAFLTLMLPIVGWAQVDTSDWKCELCPFESGYRADTVVGADYVSDDAYRFGNATGYDEAGVYLQLDGEGHYASEDYRLDWYAEDLGLDSRAFAVEGGRPGRFGFHLGYDELPYRLFDTTSTVFTATTPDTLALPAGWVRASQTSGFSELDASLQPVKIGSDRTRINLGGDLAATSAISVFADYRHETRDGIDIVSGSSFFQSSMLPRYLDFETDTIDVGVGYHSGPLSLSLAWYGSFFTNNQLSLTWDNPFSGFPGAEQGRLAQEPDNDFQQLSFSGAYVADSIRSVVSFSAAIGQGEQNAAFVPYTINPTIDAGTLSRANLDASVDTANYALTLTSRPFPKARLNLSYRYDERDNRTDLVSWSRVVVDSFASGDAELNTPYSFERARFRVGGSYRLLDSVRVSAAYERTELDRDFQEVAEQTEDTGWIRAHLSLAEWAELTVKGGTARREIDRYDTSVAESFGQNPLLRKYNLAYRFREFGEVTLSITPIGVPLTLDLSTRFANDNFSKSEIGLTDSDSLNLSADLGYRFSDNGSIYLLAGMEDIDALQSGSASFSSPTWQAVHRDRFDHYGAGIQLRQLGERASLNVEYLATDGDTSINVRASNGGVLPNITSELESLRLTLGLELNDRAQIDLSARYESFKTSDWAIEGVEPDTISTVLTLGADPWDYDTWVVGVGFRYLIGPRKISFPE